MKTLPVLLVGASAMLNTGVTLAQNGNMMNGGGDWMGGYGGVWTPLLLVIVVAGLVAWIVSRGRK
ncbi:hypothetical protein BH11PSE12_BH11PSE12_26990 [soil metagenome]